MTIPSTKAQGSGVPEPATSPGPDPRRWLILAVASAAQFLAVLDLIAVNIAFPAIGADFRSASTAALSWVLNAYTIVLAALLVPAGRLADETGRRRSFLLGMALFGVASLGCGAVPGLGWLIAARVVQGVAAAVVVPTSLSLALPAFAPHERATAVGVWTAVSAVAASSGPVVGGLLAASDWRWIFLINVPVVLVAVAAGLWILPRTEPVRAEPVPTEPVRSESARTEPVRPVRTGPVRSRARRLDPLGTLLVLLATGSLTTACVEAPDWGYAAPATLAFLATGLAAAALCAAHMRRHPDPVVDPELFRTRGFTTATLGLLSYFLAYSAMLLSATWLFTGVWGYSTRRAGVAIAAWPLTVLVVSMPSGRIVRVLGERRSAVLGAAAFTAAPVWWLVAAGPSGDGAHYTAGFLPGLVLAGIGAGLYQPVMFAAAGLLPAHRLSLGSGVLMMSRQGGTALGVAALVVVTGGAHQPDLGALRAGWVFAALTAAVAALAGAVFRTGQHRVGTGQDRAARRH
ncbi:MFS transporter [Streptomyces sp. NBS 14/10]|uniref:MFS transporter n=1 Tax=Streptomyces sp. NBS 14/10 TaxID=1945643 RepID=UPI000B7F2D7D|nr:MFS transporter [Streptomyces sp. NBS 14/10]KAK1182702.1 MFS transporter [Streptomyces sp. NBS 14/10]